MRRSIQPLATLGFLISTAACGSSDLTPQSPVARSFDELARAVARCAEALRDCDEEDAGSDGRGTCVETFLSCRADAGEDAQSALEDEISSCQERAQNCAADAGDDKAEAKCDTGLRACIGEARPRKDADSDAAAPNPDAPTYQCFGQLRECVTDKTGPRECAQQARACVISAVGEPRGGRPPVTTPRDAGMPRAGSSGSIGGGRGGSPAGAAGSAGHAGGKAGRGGSESGTGGARAGAGGRPSDDDDRTSACAAAYDACIAGGEKPMLCERDQRMCLKGKGQQDDGDQR